MQRQRVWTVRKHHEMGRYTVQSITPCGEPIVLDFFDSGGFVGGTGVWRFGRIAVLQSLKASLGVELTREQPLPLHVRSDRNGELECALEIDASRFSGGKRVSENRRVADRIARCTNH